MLNWFVLGVLKQLLKVYYKIKPYITWCKAKIYPSILIEDVKMIPIIINNRNRFSCLKQQIQILEKFGYTNIYIIDNASTYSPLLEYYDTECPYTVFYLGQNMGHLALWKSGLIKRFGSSYFVYTDPDVIPDENCPCNFMEKFLCVMQEYPFLEKVGFSLRIDDLPDTFDKKQQVVNWEKQFWKKKIADNPPLYKAAIDTTFALYRPYYFVGGNLHSPNIRVGDPYMAKHVPWYNDSSHLSEEEIYYIQHSETSTHWSTGKLK